MSEYLELRTDQDVSDFIASVDWHDAFLREAYMLSPGFVEVSDDEIAGIRSYGVLPSAKCLICTSSGRSPAVEIVFRDVHVFCVDVTTEFNLSVSWRNGAIHWKFQVDRPGTVICKSAMYRHLDLSALGDNQMYSWEPV